MTRNIRVAVLLPSIVGAIVLGLLLVAVVREGPTVFGDSPSSNVAMVTLMVSGFPWWLGALFVLLLLFGFDALASDFMGSRALIFIACPVINLYFLYAVGLHIDRAIAWWRNRPVQP